MGFLDVVGDAAGWVGDRVGDAAGWVGDKVGDAVDGVGDFFSGNVGTQAVAAPDFVPKILASKGAPDWHNGAQTATDLAKAHNEVSSQVQKMSSNLESVWTGSGSEAAQAKIKPLGDVANAASQTFTSNAQNLTGLAHGFDDLKQNLTPMPATPPHKNFGDVLSPWDTDTEDQINKYNQDAQQNIARYGAYSEQAQAAGQSLKTDYGQIGDFNSGNITLEKQPKPPAKPKKPWTPPPTKGHDPGTGITEPTDQHPPGTTQWTPPPTTPTQQQQQHVPTGHTETSLPHGVDTSQTNTTQTSGYKPPTTTPPGFTPPPLSPYGTGDGSSSGTGGLNSFTGGGFGPGGSGFGGGSSSGGGTGGVGSGGGSGSRLSGGSSSGTGSAEEGAAGRGATGSGSGAAGGAAGRSGAPGMGAAGGKKGEGSEDEEHQRKYLLEDDSAFSLVDENGDGLVDPNTGMAVAPPTLGG